MYNHSQLSLHLALSNKDLANSISASSILATSISANSIWQIAFSKYHFTNGI